MNICDITSCEVSANVAPALFAGVLIAVTQTEIAEGSTIVMTKGNQAIIKFAVASDEINVPLDFEDYPQFLEPEGNPYIIQIYGADGAPFDGFLNAAGDATTCLTFNVVNGILTPDASITLNPAVV